MINRDDTTHGEKRHHMKKILTALASIVCIGAFIGYFGLRKADPKTFATDLLALADIKINGSNPWDMRIYNEQLYPRVLSNGSLGLGEAYMDGWWDSPALDQFFHKLLSAKLDTKIPRTFNTLWTTLKAKLINLQSPHRAYQVGEEHYDLGNTLFNRMLDPHMLYSCGYWKNADCLEKAQEHKLDLICRKLNLKPGMKLLDIGCGWGGLARYAAKNYGVSVVGVTISKEQAHHAQELSASLPIEIRLQDYRDIKEKFDRIVSVGMFEHVGYKNYDTFMDITHRLLKEDGLMLLHTIGSNASQLTGDEWLNKYIFPNGMLPSIQQIADAAQGRFVMEDWHNFGADYDKSLMSWYHNFEKHWPELKTQYSERFYRMWKYYLLSCAGMFRARAAQLWQVILSKNGVAGGYQSIR